VLRIVERHRRVEEVAEERYFPSCSTTRRLARWVLVAAAPRPGAVDPADEELT
jgi:hypothetical protein